MHRLDGTVHDQAAYGVTRRTYGNTEGNRLFPETGRLYPPGAGPYGDPRSPPRRGSPHVWGQTGGLAGPWGFSSPSRPFLPFCDARHQSAFIVTIWTGTRYFVARAAVRA